MKKTLIAAFAVAALAASIPMQAEAQWRRGPGPGIAMGVIAGTMLGAAAASAASGPRYYEPAPRYYEAPPAYVVDEPRCWMERRWVDTDYGPRRMRVRVCE